MKEEVNVKKNTKAEDDILRKHDMFLGKVPKNNIKSLNDEYINDVLKKEEFMNGSEFKKLRSKLGLTQEELANVLGLASKQVICNIEIDVRKPSKLVAVVLKYLTTLSEKEAEAFKTKLMELGKEYDRKKAKEEDL